MNHLSPVQYKSKSSEKAIFYWRLFCLKEALVVDEASVAEVDIDVAGMCLKW